MKENKNW